MLGTTKRDIIHLRAHHKCFRTIFEETNVVIYIFFPCHIISLDKPANLPTFQNICIMRMESYNEGINCACKKKESC